MALPKTRGEEINSPKDKIDMNELADEIKNRSASIVSRTSERIEGAKNAVADRFDTLADSIRDKVPASSVLTTAANRVADTVETAGDFLHEQKMAEVGGNVIQVVRRYPLASILVGFGFGALLGRALRR